MPKAVPYLWKIFVTNNQLAFSMDTSGIQTLTFIFDNKTDHLLLHQIAGEGPLKRKHSGIKGDVGLTEDINRASIRAVREASGLDVSEVVLRGVVKSVSDEGDASTVFFIFESSKFSGEMENKLAGRLKWVDILHVFNLQMEGLVEAIMPNLLDGESFFEGLLVVNQQDEIVSSEIRICNSI